VSFSSCALPPCALHGFFAERAAQEYPGGGRARRAAALPAVGGDSRLRADFADHIAPTPGFREMFRRTVTVWGPSAAETRRSSSGGAADSEGTLGGLVRLGEPEHLGRQVQRTLEQMRLCTSDPFCAEHHPCRDGVTLHGAACHACLFAPETSCEHGNRYFDRAVLVETVTHDRHAFFKGRR